MHMLFLAQALLALQPTALAGVHRRERGSYRFTTLDNPADPHFNVLWGINDAGVIGGYYGSGGAQDPFNGYILKPPYTSSDYTIENYPGAAQSQVIAIDKSGQTLGYEIDQTGNGENFVDWKGTFSLQPKPLYGLNASGKSVYTHYPHRGQVGYGFVYIFDTRTGKSKRYFNSESYGIGAYAINDEDDVAGTQANRFVPGEWAWVVLGGTKYMFGATLPEPENSVLIVPFGINNNGVVVGEIEELYTGRTHGFILPNVVSKPISDVLDDPSGMGHTIIHGINDAGDVVGQYTDANGDTHGFLATPQ